MDELLFWLPTILFAGISLVIILRDPRRMRCAFFATATLGMVAFNVLLYLLAFLDTVMGDDLPFALAAGLILAFLSVAGVAIFLIWAGIVLLVREGPSLSHSLSLVMGMGMLWYFVGFFVAARTDRSFLINFLILLGLPLFTFSFALSSFVLYSTLYGLAIRILGKAGESTVVLGSGLVGDRVPPLLARRVDLGVEWFLKACARWDSPALVTSGGQGPSELVSEGSAMMRYAKKTVPELLDSVPNGAELFIEERSVNTEQNLVMSRELLLAGGRDGPLTVVSSDYHAFRAANLMSRLGIPGNSVGARSRSYFWASAKLREFAAILALNKVTTAVAFGLSVLPLCFLVWYRIAALF